MIRTEILENNRIRHYSDLGYTIRQIETGNFYEDAVDILPCIYTYEESDELIPSSEIEPEEALNIITGGFSLND